MSARAKRDTLVPVPAAFSKTSSKDPKLLWPFFSCGIPLAMIVRGELCFSESFCILLGMAFLKAQSNFVVGV